MISISTVLAALTLGLQSTAPAAQPPIETPGCLSYQDATGKTVFCPLKGTDVVADIAGFGARVTVKQSFTNTSSKPIEAIYTFPLPSDSAVDRMSMRIGDRVIEGAIKRREEARRIYEAARNAGQTAALLDQERPNIFTQSIANLTPGQSIDVTISYVQTLKFESGSFEFSYPMVVGPRYVDVRTTDPNKITPPITPKLTRTGAGMTLTLNIDAGMPIEAVTSKLHDIDVQRNGSKATVKLARRDEIPNRDFILSYQVAGQAMKSSFLSYADPQNGGFFTLILMPPKAPVATQIAPKEVIFVMDQSGSQSGFPIEKSKILTLKLIDTLNPNDTFNVLSFNTGCTMLWNEPRQFSQANRAEAYKFVQALQANGGTNLVDALKGALAQGPDSTRRRLIVFNTDGYIGNDFDALDAIVKSPSNARIFTFGIGNAVNRFLIEGMSAEGRGDSEIVTLADDAEAAVKRFVKRTKNPVLMDPVVKFEGVKVVDVLPKRIPDVFGDHPILIRGRYLAPGKGRVVLSGSLGGDDPWSQSININLPDSGVGGGALTDLSASIDENEQGSVQDDPANGPLGKGSAIATLWARAMIDEFGRADYHALQAGNANADASKQITNLALRFGLMSQFTSFVAVESRVVNVGGKSVRVHVPVEMADGVSYEGIFGGEDKAKLSYRSWGATGPGGGGGLGGGGFGGGGFGNATGASAPVAAKSAQRLGLADREIEGAVVLLIGDLDKLSDADFVQAVRNYTPAQETQALKSATPKQRERYFYLTRVDKALRASKSKRLNVQIWIAKPDQATRAKLEAAGFHVDAWEIAMKAGFGSCDASALKSLAQVPGVRRIAPL